jgi:type IV secretion system protein VirD4
MARSGPQGLYSVDQKRSDPALAFFRGIGVIVIGSLLAIWVATQLVAMRFGYQPALGAPLAGHVYEPWAGIRWSFAFRNAHDPRIGAILGEFWSVFGFGFAFFLAVAFLLIARSIRRSRGNKTDLHGSAHWATEQEVKASKLLGNSAGVYVGAWVDSGGRTRYLRHDGPEHVLAFAPTRSGKGVGLVIPTLLSWPGSVIVHDIKGENYALTSGWRAKDLGSTILRFDPASPTGSVRFNPLGQVRLRTEYEIRDVQNIVQILTDPDGKAGQGEESHWIATSSALLVGVILHVLYAEPDKTLAGVASFLSDPAFEATTQMYHCMLGGKHDPEMERGWLDVSGQPTVTHPVVAMAARDMLNKDPKEATGVLSTAIRFLTLFRDPIVARNTSASDFTVESLMNDDHPASLYIIVPPSDMDRIKPLTRLMFNQILRGLTAEMSFQDGQSVAHYRHRLLMMIDELPSLGRLEIMQSSLAFMAGYGIKGYLICQDTAQLRAAYGQDETIMANCHVQVAYAPNKMETAELISKMAGSMTVSQEQRSYSGSRFGIRGNVQVNMHETERPLVTPDEVRRLPADDALVFVSGHAPIYGKKIKYYSDPTFSARAKIVPPGPVAPVASPQGATA